MLDTDSRDIKVLHIEPTDVCQAKCPACARETNPLFNHSSQHHLSFDQILQVFDSTKIAQLNKMFMCGNYGDPAAGKHTLEIYQAFRKINPSIVLGMNTNGAIQNTKWWKDIGALLSQQQDYVVFSIDGLEDTNHIYRQGVHWRKLIENVQSFINAGGSAHWDMLVYRHNEHQVDQCEQLAKSLGFKWFRAKVSKRKLVHNLEYPITIERPSYNTTIVDCHILKEKSLYIDAHGSAYPCCWLGVDINNTYNFTQLQESWTTLQPHPTCKQACSSNNLLSNFNNQWRKEIQLC